MCQRHLLGFCPTRPRLVIRPAVVTVALLALALAPLRAETPESPPRPLGRVVYEASGPLVIPPPDPVELTAPLDLGLRGRASPDFAPSFLPEARPGASFEDLAGYAYRTSPWLRQGGWDGVNPFLDWERELRRLREDPDRAWWRLAQAAAFAYLFAGPELSPQALVEAVISPPEYLNEELLTRLAVPQLRRLLPPEIVGIEDAPGQVPADLAVLTGLSYDSVAPLESTLLTAAEHGLRAVAVADRGRLDGAQLAARVAARLQREGRLPEDFTVIPGEFIETTSGPVLALFLPRRIPEGMTLRYTLELIHREGGLAYLARPAEPGGRRLLRDLPFDGYLSRLSFFDLYRASRLLQDPELACLPQLHASEARYSSTVGLLYSHLESDSTDLPALREALRDRRVYGASGLHLPLLAGLSLSPVSALLGTLNHFFEAHDRVESTMTRLLGADRFRLVTSWDGEMMAWMNLWQLPHGLVKLFRGDSAFNRLPQVEEVALEYGPLQLRYLFPEDEVSLRTVLTW